MKEQLLLYGVCAAIAIVAVAVTSLLKIVVCAIAKRSGRSLSGNIKEYLFTPIAILLAAGGEYLWLERFMHIEDEQLFILLVVCFSLGTMLIYWLLFQPTRKAAVNIIRAIAKRSKFSPIVEAVEQSGFPELLSDENNDLQSDAENGKAVIAETEFPDQTQDTKVDAFPPTAEEQLRDMVNALKEN